MVLQHNHLCDIFVDFCHKANLSVKVEVGSTLTPELSRSRSADALVSNWSDGIPTAFDITVTSPLTSGSKCHTWNCCTTVRAEEAPG